MPRLIVVMTAAALMAFFNILILVIPAKELSNAATAPPLRGRELREPLKLQWPSISASERKLFSPLERVATVATPSAPIQPEAALPGPAVLATQLIGIVGVDGMLIALFQIEGQLELQKVSEGNELNGWIISQINTRSVEMNLHGSKKILYLDPPT